MQMSGLVAILSQDGLAVIDVRDLGPTPVAVKSGRVLPLTDIKPALQTGQEYSTPIFAIGSDVVTRTWPVIAIDFASVDTVALNDALMAPGSVDRAELKTLFNHENRLRALEGKQAITQAQFVAALQAAIR